MKKQKIEDIFSSMENFSSVPPPELWGQIEEKLNKPKKKKRAILWWSAAACLLLGLMLPSIFHFNSGSEIKEVHTNGTENNSVVLEENQSESTSNKTVSAEQNTISPKSGTVSSPEELLKQSRSSGEKVQKQEVADADANNNTNSDSSNQELSSGKKNANQAVAENTTVTEKENALKSTSKNQIVSTKKRNTNQGLAAKTFSPEKQNAFNTASKNQTSAADKGNENQIIAEKTFSTKKQNLFNADSQKQILDTDKRKANQILAEKTFNARTQNPFSANSKNQLSNSLFEGKQNSKNSPNSNNSFALNSSATFLNDSQSKTDKSGKESKNELVIAEKSAVENQKSNSKFNDVVLSKQDSVQLAVLQNLEKGITNPENKKETEKAIKAKSNAEKWAVEVFAGVANSENYKNEKTLGHVNDSKQSNTYGVKTKYKINKKWAVGSGFKINELGQSIANVSYVNVSEKNNALASYSDYYIQSSATPQIATNSDYVFVSNSSKEVLKSNNLQTGNLDQSLKYIEMPLEVSYAVFSKNKTSISLNTGGFVGKLISNNVALDGNSIGKNIDANDFVYGSVLSSTVQYRIYKKTNVFVEPAMNYYLNPLSNQSFNQFQWGLNFGLNVSF
ncbi:hypothetical protein D0809_15915 [Flavobacterium circumlabens]|uniref:Outer membrane protein beta-barrel domain-containing protein n=1 Tax=Flavobacterium circumlabens TaxID=2133765 RepID=A0A4Y7UCS4_9FLAO|nr:hypothetical protein [Flavobacterium circumlabens]TCN56621.1 hypothetical protein EV142_105406 [Flavobacterium circumlabens]TEB43629.1 hypothetical protein D0809_15915 [Flavobacterium circumlabens]